MATKTKQVSKPRINAANGNKTSAKAQRREEFTEQHKSARMLGEVVTWNTGGTAHIHADIVQALKDASLDDKVARELLPRHAFSRAAKKLTEERVIDVLRDEKDTITFQFTKRVIESDEWSYKKETLLKLDKTSGKITCDIPALEAKAQQELDRAMEVRTSADITKMIQKLFDAEADLFPIRDQGGVYFVPDQYVGFTAKVETFVQKIGGRINRFPVPANTAQGDRSVSDAIVNGLSLVIADHEEAVEGFGLDTRHDTIARQAEKIKQTRVKVEAYAQYLQDKKDELLESVEKANVALRARVQRLTEERAKSPATMTSEGGRQVIFGWAATAVIRWMGRQLWGFKQARKVLDKFGAKDSISDATIRAQLQGGRDENNPRGEPAKLTPEQEEQLTKALVEGEESQDDEAE
jgi:hypothetical protein